MKETLLDILRCPDCKSGLLQLENSRRDSLEISSGRLLCKKCLAGYEIEDGIINFLEKPSEQVLREIKAMREDEYIKDEAGCKYRITPETIEKFSDKFFLLPEGDRSYFFTKGGSFQNMAEAAGRFYSAMDHMKLTGKESILEIGACFSYASFKFAKKGCRVVAMDISDYLLAANLFIKKAYFDRVYADMHSMPFVENSFDIVYGAAVLHHSKILRDVFMEIRRILKPCGRLVLINESSRGVFEKVHPVFDEMEKKGFGDTSYTIPEWKKGARLGGFDKIKIDFLSIADDYISRHLNRNSKHSIKMSLMEFIRLHRRIEGFLLFLLIPLRLFFRPKSWRIVCYKNKTA